MFLFRSVSARLLFITAAALLFSISTPERACGADPVAVAIAYNKGRGEVVTVEGKIQEFRSSDRPNIPNSFMLKDESGTIRVAIWPNVFEEIPGRERIADGAAVKVTGKVAEFRGKSEIHVRTASDVELAAGAAAGVAAAALGAAPRSPGTGARQSTGPAVVHAGVSPTAALRRDRLNDTFTVSGKLTSARRPSNVRAPYILHMADPTGEIDVIFWEDLASQLPESKQVEPGDQLQATGKLGEHRGNLQLRVGSPDDLKTPKSDPDLFQTTDGGDAVKPTAPRAAAEAVTPGEVASLPIGKRVSVSGRVAGIEPLRLGRRVRLQGEETTGPEAVLLLWDTAEGLKPEVHYLKTSSTLAVAGTVAEARGEKVVVVSEPEDVLAVTP